MTEAVQAAPAESPAQTGRVTFWEFFSNCFVPEMGWDIPIKKAHRDCCDVLERVILGEITENIIVVNIPPRVGKTKMMQALCCWQMGNFPDSQIIYTSYTGDLAEEALAAVKKTMMAPWFVRMYGDLVHASKADKLSIMGGGAIFAEGTGGTLTGKGGGLKRLGGGFIIVDDPAKPDAALSAVEAESCRRWFENTLKDRRNSSQFCPIIICAQRLAPLDLPGHLLKEFPEQCHLVTFPAMVDPGTGEASEQPDAISAFPETITTEELRLYQRTRIGRFVLASKYQQRPTTLGGNMIPVGEFDGWNPNTIIQFERTVITVDTALKTKQANDFSALELWGLFRRKAYLIDLMHGKWESPDLLENTKFFWKKWTMRELTWIPQPRLMIEEKAAGTPLLQNLRRDGIPAIGIERDIDKVRRVQNILPYVETHMVVIPNVGTVPWRDKFVTECGEFQLDGTQAHDDMVDAMVDGIEQLLAKSLSSFDVLLDNQAR